MRDSLAVEVPVGEEMPHVLTVARLEVMRPTISPHIDGVKALTELEVQSTMMRVLGESGHECVHIGQHLLLSGGCRCHRRAM